MKSDRRIFFVTELLGLILVLSAPEVYSFNFCALLNVLYIALNVFYFIHHRDNIIGFSGLFALSFYFVNFVYPVFYYPNPYLRAFSLYGIAFDEKIISYATAVAFLAYNTYLLGMSYYVPKVTEKGQNRYLSNQQYKLLVIFFAVVFIMFLASGGFNYFALQYTEGISAIAGNFALKYLVLLQAILFEMLLICLFSQRSIYDKWKTIIVGFAIVVMAIYLLSGNRSNVLTYGLIILFMYNDKIRKIKLRYFVILSIAGALIFSAVGMFRGSGFKEASYEVFNDEMDSGLDFFSDLTINNRALYTLISDAKNNGLNLGTQISNFTPLPYMGSFVCYIFGVPHNQSGSAVYNSYLSMGNDISAGLGTNCVSDAYIGFGLIGTIIIFFLLGYYLSKYKHKSSQYQNVFYDFFYYSIASSAIFMCRGSVWGWLKSFVWMWIVYEVIVALKGQRNTLRKV